MKILLDECVPRSTKRLLTGHFVRTAQQAGFAGYKNGELIKAAEAESIFSLPPIRISGISKTLPNEHSLFSYFLQMIEVESNCLEAKSFAQ